LVYKEDKKKKQKADGKVQKEFFKDVHKNNFMRKKSFVFKHFLFPVNVCK
jgi:hypothetical protein